MSALRVDGLVGGDVAMYVRDGHAVAVRCVGYNVMEIWVAGRLYRRCSGNVAEVLRFSVDTSVSPGDHSPPGE